MIFVYGFITGISDTDTINYCPKCGEEITERYGNGMAECGKCGLYFGVIEGGGGESEEQ